MRDGTLLDESVGDDITGLDGQLALRLVLQACLALHLMRPEVIDLIDLGIKTSAQVADLCVGEIEVLPVQFAGDILTRRIKDGECPIATSQGFEPELQAFMIAEVQALNAECILVDGNHLLIHDDLAGSLTHGAQVVAQNQRTCHHTPHGEVSTILILRHAIAYLQHIGVIPIALACILAQGIIELDALHHTELGIARENTQ